MLFEDKWKNWLLCIGIALFFVIGGYVSVDRMAYRYDLCRADGGSVIFCLWIAQ